MRPVGVGLAAAVHRERDALPAKNVRVVVVGGIAEEIGQGQGEDAARRKSPAANLRQRGGAFAEVGLAHFGEREELDGPQHEAEEDKAEEPGGRLEQGEEAAARRAWRAPGAPQARSQPPGGKGGHHQQGVVGDFDVAGEDLAAESHGSDDDPGKGCAPSLLIRRPPYHHFQAAEQEGQPHRRPDDHGKDGGAHQHEAAALEHQPAEKGAAASLPQHAAQEIGGQSSQPQLQHGVPAVGAGQRQEEKDNAKRVVGSVLAGGQEGHAGEQVGIPERNGALSQALLNEIFPGVVLQDEVAEEVVLRVFDAQFGGVVGPGLPLEEVICRQHRFAANGDATIEQKRQDEVACEDDDAQARVFDGNAFHAC